MLAITFGFFLRLGIQDEPTEAFRLTVVLENATIEGKPAFVFSGKTDLPDGAVVMIDLLRVGTQEGAQLFAHATRVEKGSWRDVAHIFSSKNPAGKYYARARYELKFQDRKDVGEAIVKMNRKLSTKAEAWLQIGDKDDFEKEYRAICLRLAGEIDEMAAVAKLAQGHYELFLKGSEPVQWKKEMLALKDKVSEVERRNADRIEYRYFEVTDVSHVGLEQLRGAIWALLDNYLRAAGAPEHRERLEQEITIRHDTLRQFIRKFKSELQIAHIPTTDLGTLVKDIRGCLDRAVQACQALEPTRVRAHRVGEHRQLFEQLLIDLAHVMPPDRYENVQQIAEKGMEFFDKIGDPDMLANPKRIQDVPVLVEGIQKLIDAILPAK